MTDAMTFRTLDNVDVADKRVLLRADLNVPVRGGKPSDLTRIERLSATIRVSEKSATASLCRGVGGTIAEIQLGRMTLALAVA
jgi:phosphoglycerate kinase